MITATRKWFRRNRTGFAVGVGVLGAGYVLTQYIIGKIAETRERMSSDRIARENLRRRFQQNQEDCTFTVLALLPTAAEDIIEALPVENITHELQQQKAAKLGRSTAPSEISPSEISSVAPTVAGDDKSAASTTGESFVHTSQMGASALGSEAPKSKKSKTQLWNELKISSITRSFTLIYTVALLTLFTRIQLNLLGRRSYLSSVVSLASPSPQDPIITLENHDDDRPENSYSNDFETNRKFLTFSWWLLHRGWRQVMEKVEAAVKEAFGPLNPREDVSFERLAGLVVQVRKTIEGATEEERRTQKWLPYLLPPSDLENYVLTESGILSPPSTSSSPEATPATESNPPPPAPPTAASSPYPIPPTDPLRRLLDETSDLIDSPTATHILTLLLDSLFSHLTDTALRTEAYKLPAPSTALDPATQRIAELPEMELELGLASTAPFDPSAANAKLATILAVVTRQARVIGNGVPNPYVQGLEAVRELEAFAAVVYSSNFDFESVARDQEEERDDTGGSGKGKGIEGSVGVVGVEGVVPEETVGIISAKAEESGRGKGVWGAMSGAIGWVWAGGRTYSGEKAMVS